MRIGPSTSNLRPTAPKPRGLTPDNDDLANFLKACEGGHDFAVMTFIKNWPNNTETYWTSSGHTGLLCAALGGHESTVKLLIENNAQLFATSKEGCNALMLAAQSGNQSLVTFLIGRGFKADAKDRENRSVMHHYVFGGKDDRDSGIPALLVKHGANIDEASGAGVKPLQWALSLGRKIVFRALLDLGANISDPMLEGFAAQMETTDFLEMLREEPARRAKEVDDAVSSGLGNTIKIKKPFSLSTAKVEKNPPKQTTTRQPEGLRAPAGLNQLFPRTAPGRSWTG